MTEPFKNEWTEDYAKGLDDFWKGSALELLIHGQEGLLTVQSCMSGERVLEVGCGTGRIYDVLGVTKDLDYTGLDNSPAMLKVFRDRHPGATLIEGSILGLPFPDNAFDVVICYEVIRHLEDYKTAISELHRVAKRLILFSIEVTEGESVYIGEDRHGSYLAKEAESLHYQVEYNSVEFIHWLRTAYPCNMDLRTLTNNKYIFAMRKQEKGFGFSIIPIDGWQRFAANTFIVIDGMKETIKKHYKTPGGMVLKMDITSLRPLKLNPTLVLIPPSEPICSNLNECT